MIATLDNKPFYYNIPKSNKENFICVEQFSNMVLNSNINLVYGIDTQGFGMFHTGMIEGILPVLVYNREYVMEKSSFEDEFSSIKNYKSYRVVIIALGIIFASIALNFAVFFLIKYLRSLGFDVTNDTFARNAWYFRNALCRANYSNLMTGTTSDKSFLIKFLRNLLLEEDNILENKAMQISLEMENINQNLTDLEYAVLRLIKENNKISSEELSNATGKSVRTIKTSLLSLQVKNKITRKNGKRYGYWLVI